MTATGVESRTHCLLMERAPLLDGLPLGEAAHRDTSASLPEITAEIFLIITESFSYAAPRTRPR